MINYYVVTPYEVFDEEKFIRIREQLAKENRKVMAIVFNCEDIQDFQRKYFGEVITPKF